MSVAWLVMSLHTLSYEPVNIDANLREFDYSGALWIFLDFFRLITGLAECTIYRVAFKIQTTLVPLPTPFYKLTLFLYIA